ncbi:hypothetical protein ACIRBX_12295 [Kitasatospora sp. NPDC096147]|uniref:hypothetical protein n=1 Tax=Kitasatospora sp. NPDC096147 TaxID=3364093 RepID=UPI00381F40BC
MNLRALTRGDAAVAGAAVLLFISSFLPYRTASFCMGTIACDSRSWNAWDSLNFPVLPSVFLLGIAGAALVLVQRFQGEAANGRQILGLRLDQWGTSLSFAALWSGLWALAGGGEGVSSGLGAWLSVVALLVLAGATAAGPLVPALKAPLLADKPATPAAPASPFAPGGSFQPGQPGQAGQPGAPFGYDQAQGQAAGQPQPGQPLHGGGLPGYSAQQQPQPGGYGYPTPGGAGTTAPLPDPASHQEPTQVQPAVTAPLPNPAAATPAPPAADFAPFWFAVPAPRRLTPKENPAGPPVGELLPGTWYLAVEQRGTALVAQLQDGSHGLLSDVSGIQRG